MPDINFDGNYFPDVSQNAFMVWQPGSTSEGRVPAGQGLKIHISAYSRNAQTIANAALPVLRRRSINHKFLRSTDEVRITNRGSREEVGKFITVYPDDMGEWLDIIGRLRNALGRRGVRRHWGPRVQSDQHITNVIYSRAGAYYGDYILFEGDWVEDDRSNWQMDYGQPSEIFQPYSGRGHTKKKK